MARTRSVPVTARPSGVVLKYVRPAGADVERAAGERRQAFLDELLAAVDDPRDLGAVFPGAGRDTGHVRFVVLADVGGIGARHGAIRPHPGDGDRRVETAGEGDADTFSDGQ